MRVLLRIWSQQQHSPEGIRINNRKLTTDCHISRSGVPAALANLTSLNLLTMRAGNTRTAGFYRVCAFDAIRISGPKIGPLTRQQWPENQTTVDLFSGHGGPITGPPLLDPKGLAAAAAALDFDFATLSLIDRVLSAKPKQTDAQTLQQFRGYLHRYYEQFGRERRSSNLCTQPPLLLLAALRKRVRRRGAALKTRNPLRARSGLGYNGETHDHRRAFRTHRTRNRGPRRRAPQRPRRVPRPVARHPAPA